MKFENLDIGDTFELQSLFSKKKIIARKTGPESIEILTKNPRVEHRRPSPSPPDVVEIYDSILALECVKGNGSLWPKERFRHDFNKGKTKAKIYGLKDGSILIRGKKKLWKNFNYSGS